MPPALARWGAIWLPFLDAAEAGLWVYFVTNREVVAVERPAVLVAGERLHCEVGPAVAWPNGARYWFWHGVQVPQRVIERPETITVEEVDKEANAEVRRVMVERYGLGRRGELSGAAAYIRDGRSKRLDHEDGIGNPLVPPYA